MDNWPHDTAGEHPGIQITHIRPSPRNPHEIIFYSFCVKLREDAELASCSACRNITEKYYRHFQLSPLLIGIPKWYIFNCLYEINIFNKLITFLRGMVQPVFAENAIKPPPNKQPEHTCWRLFAVDRMSTHWASVCVCVCVHVCVQLSTLSVVLWLCPLLLLAAVSVLLCSLCLLRRSDLPFHGRLMSTVQRLHIRRSLPQLITVFIVFAVVWAVFTSAPFWTQSSAIISES